MNYVISALLGIPAATYLVLTYGVWMPIAVMFLIGSWVFWSNKS